MEIITWIVIVPLAILVAVLLKASVVIAHPSFRKTKSQVKPENRTYSDEVLRDIEEGDLDRGSIEEAIARGQKSVRHGGFKYRYECSNGRLMVVCTDKNGNVQSVGA